MYLSNAEFAGKARPAGFTLVELLVVVAIIGVLSGMIGVNIAQVRVKARDDRRVADMASLATALELSRSATKKYPVPNSNPQYQDVATLQSALVPAYLANLPEDPKHSRPVGYYFGKGYVYATNLTTVDGAPRSPGANFVVDATLESKEVGFPLDSYLGSAPGSHGTQGFFKTAYYRYDGKIHYQIGR